MAATGADASLPLVGKEAGSRPELELLAKWWKEGTAAGHEGDGYDNRDRGHSLLPPGLFPRLQVVKYTPEELGRRADWGICPTVRPQVVVGNSSTARDPRYGGSNSRVMYMNPGLLDVLRRQYEANNLYVYPEHQDHDPGRNGIDGAGFGDLFPLNTPYLLTSQGSSGSDQPFLQAVFATLAAFRPETKKRLVQERVLMPAVQMLLRLCATNVGDTNRYLAPGAHPSVFEGAALDPVRMVTLAHEMKADEIPAVSRVRVVEEDSTRNGTDAWEGGPGERWADTTGAVARLWRGRAGQRRMVLSADGSYDVNGRPLTFRWVVTRGDAAGTRIRPLNERGSVVEVVFNWRGQAPVEPDGRIESARQDLALFVHNGAWWSAPAFVTWYANARERRAYDADRRWVDVMDRGGTATAHVDHLLPVMDWLQQSEPDPGATAFLTLAGPERLSPIFQAAIEVKPFEESWVIRRREWDEARESTSAAQKAIDAAQASREPGGDTNRTAELKMRVEEARTRERTASLLFQAADTAARTAQRDWVRAIEVLVLEWIHDPDLVRAHREVWEPLFEQASPEARRNVGNARDRAELWGMKRDPASEWAIVPRTAGNLTESERSLRAEYHVTLVNELIRPRGIRVRFTVDHAEVALFPSANWRDVARRDADGFLLGWDRFSDGPPQEFWRDGTRVTERDEGGRPVRTQGVTYRVEGSSVRVLPDTVQRRIAYDGPADRRGRVVYLP